MAMKQHIAVKLLIVDSQNRVLLLQKSQDDVRHAGKSGRYNLPGGKILVGESVAAAVKREIVEETGLTIGEFINKPFFVGEWRPVVENEALQIIGIFYVCRAWQGELSLDSEHDAYVWVVASDLGLYDILPPEDEALELYFSQRAS